MNSILNIIIPNNNKLLAIIIKSLLILLLILFPFGIIFMLRGLITEDYFWLVSLYLSIISVISILYFISITEKITSIFFVGAIFILCTALEAIGLKTGYLFGEYYYSESFIPFLPGPVPLAITFSWVFIVINSFIICRQLIPKPRNSFVIPLSAAFIILSFDIMLEPFGSFINKYWIWKNNFIPFQNFFTWFIMGFTFVYMLEKSIKFLPLENFKIISLPLLLMIILITQLLIINFANGYWLYTLAGFLLMISVIRTIKRKYKDAV